MAKPPTDLTVKILREIRDEIRSTNQRLDQTNQRLDHVEGALVDLAEQQRFVVRDVKALAERDAGLGLEVDDLRSRVKVLEKKVGGKRG